MKILIVGGIAGGATAAARLRRLNEENEIIIFEKNEHISFANCGLPYHIGGVIKNEEALIIQTAEKMKSRFNIDVRIKTKVKKIDAERKVVIATDLSTGESFEESYDKILLSTGAELVIPEIKNINSSRVFSLRNTDDMKKIMTHIKENNVKKSVVVGAGFLGMEMAENVFNLGIQTTIVESLGQVLNSADKELAAKIHQNIKDNEVELHLNSTVVEIVDEENKSVVKLVKAQEKDIIINIETEMIILATGVKPNINLAVSAGCNTDEKLGVLVDDNMQTTVKDIYAVGDMIAVKNYISKNQTNIPLAWSATRQGRLAADAMLERKTQQVYKGTMGTRIVKTFDYTVGVTGLNEKQLKESGLTYGKDYYVATIEENNIVGYFPGAAALTLKVMFSKNGKILGAQGIGTKGVDKRIDVLATAIRCDMHVAELQELELACAPQFNSAKDPVNVLGYYAENILNGEVKVCKLDELENLLSKENYEVLDVRTAEEREVGSIPNSLHIELENLRTKMNELNKEKTYIVYCQVGFRGYVAYKLLVNSGYKALNLDGGYKLWEPNSCEQSNVGIFKETNIENESTSSGIKIIGEERNLEDMKIIEVDACGLACPGPILKTKKTMEEMAVGDILKITSSELGFKKDIKVWAEKTGNKLIGAEKVGSTIVAQVQKLGAKTMGCPAGEGVKIVETTKNKQTMVVFSGDMDKVLASFIIANGALAMGKEVTMFFTFWGLNALRKENFVNNKKSIIDKMFGMMMPKGPNKLKLSNMNMGGMGTLMMKKVMRDKNVETLPSLMKMFFDNGGKIIACDMSVDVMGFSHDELIDEVEYGGVAAFLGESEESFSTLFI